MSVTVRINDDEVLDALDRLDPRGSKRALQKATKKAGTFLARKARPEAPRKSGRLRKSVTTRAAKRDKPGSYVTARAPHRHLVQLGTRDRFNKSGAFRGRMPANPFIARTADNWGDQALDEARDDIVKALEL